MRTFLTDIQEFQYKSIFMEYLKQVWEQEGKKELTQDYFQDELKEIAGNTDDYSNLKEQFFDSIAIDLTMVNTMRLINHINKQSLDNFGTIFQEEWTETTLMNQSAYWFIHDTTLQEFKTYVEEPNE